MRFAALIVSGGAAALLMSFLMVVSASASSISIAPLTYQTALKANEDQKGYVDILNPEASDTEVHLKVQAFRQIDNEGSLQFYDDAAIAEGVKLDLTEVLLGPNEGIRIYFILDASVLPSGDVFAAILANTGQASEGVVSVPSAQVGTLLLLTNGTPPAHHATVSKFSADWLQVGSGITAQIDVTNTDPAEGRALGFIPKIQFGVNPYHSQTVDGPLIFSGRSRVVDYIQKGDYFGPVILEASVNGNTQTRLVFAITGYWQWLAPLLFITFIGLVVFCYYWVRKHPLKRAIKQGS